MEYMTESGLSLNYEYQQARRPSAGTRTLVLIHGMGFDLTSWDRMIPFMEEDHHVLRYDFRGHGRSGTGEIDPSRLAWIYVEHLNNLLEHLGIADINLISHGAGCIISLYYNEVYPAKVRSNVLLSLPLFNSSNTAYKYADYRKALMKQQSMRALADHVVPNVSLFPPDSPETGRLYEAFARVTFDVYIELLDFFAGAHTEIMDIFKRYSGPLLLLTGERDPMYPPYLSSLIASANPNCRFMTIYNASNMLFYDQPEETYKQIRMFYDSEWSRRAPLDPYLQELHSEFINMVSTDPAEPPPVRLKVTMLKQFQVFVDGAQVLNGWGRRSAKDLLIYLLLSPVVTRDRICEDLWKDTEAVKARNQLRVCLNHLKQLLNNEETELIYSDNQQIALQGPVDCDLLELLKETSHAMAEKNTQMKGKRILEIFSQIDGDVFCHLNQEWVLNLRTRLEIQLITLAHHQAEALVEQGSYTSAIACLQYVIMFNPEEYDAYERIAQLYGLNNQKHEARKWRSRLAKLAPAKEQPVT